MNLCSKTYKKVAKGSRITEKVCRNCSKTSRVNSHHLCQDVCHNAGMHERTIFLGSDHGGFVVKEHIREWLQQQKSLAAEVIDEGPYELDPTDSFVPAGAAVARDVSLEHVSVEDEPQVLGILVCRTGGGMAIVANRFPGVRAVVCSTEAAVEHARRHNNANVLVLEGDMLRPEQAEHLVERFLRIPFDGGRHIERLQQIEELEV